jgi:UDPglucose 6-dehydrogenase
MQITVIGTGYVGLVAGVCFADAGNHVTCVDLDAEKLALLKAGKVPFYEPGLEEMVERNRAAERLEFTGETAKAVAQSEVVFIAVGTPQGEDGSSDLQYVLKAVESVKEAARGDLLLVLKSTVPVGTADAVRAVLKGCPFSIEVVSNPEFLKEGAAIGDFMRPERVVIGTDSLAARQKMELLYAPFVRNGSPILLMSNRSAELTKYAANTFLAMKVSFINQIAALCEKAGASVHDVRKGIITDSRIGSKFLYPGCGYGGSCFPKDVQALVHLGKELGMPLRLFEEIHSVNEVQKKLLYSKISKHFGKGLSGKVIALWGLSFKPETDDMREAPSVALIRELLENGATVSAYDPVAIPEAKRLFGDSVEFHSSAMGALRGADALAILTEWNEFRSPNFPAVQKEMPSAVVFDGRNLYAPESMEQAGFTYYCVGRPDPT